MKSHQDYADLVAQAERAVAAVKDPDLKRIAFQKVLDDLLGSSGAKQPAPSRPTRKAHARDRSKAKPNTRGPKAYIHELIEEGFFKKPKTISQVKAELENRGHHIPLTSLSGPLGHVPGSGVTGRSKPRASAPLIAR